MCTQLLTVADGKIAFDDQGVGPLILCVPAGGDLRSEYRFLTPLLVAAGYRVVTMDLRGQGESTAKWPSYTATDIGRDMLALLQYLNAGPATVIATSKPVQAAVWLAVEAPELTSALILSGGYARAQPAWRAKLMAETLLAPLWGHALYASFFPTLYPTTRPPDFDEHFNKVKAMLREPGRLRAMRRIFTDNGQEADARVEQVQVPVLVVMGSRDPDFKQPEQEAQAFAARFHATQAKVALIEGAGHHPQAEMPEQTAAYFLDFLASQVVQREALRR